MRDFSPKWVMSTHDAFGGRRSTGLIQAAPCVRGRGAPGPAATETVRETGDGRMKEAKTNENTLAEQRSKETREHRDEEAMSPSIRDLILSFGVVDSDPAWDPSVYTRRGRTTSPS